MNIETDVFLQESEIMPRHEPFESQEIPNRCECSGVEPCERTGAFRIVGETTDRLSCEFHAFQGMQAMSCVDGIAILIVA